MANKPDKADVAERLLLTRQALGLSQREFCEAAGLSASRYSHYEAGRFLPSLEAAISLSETYGLTLDWIFRGDPGNLPVHVFATIKSMRAARRAK